MFDVQSLLCEIPTGWARGLGTRTPVMHEESHSQAAARCQCRMCRARTKRDFGADLLRPERRMTFMGLADAHSNISSVSQSDAVLWPSRALPCVHVPAFQSLTDHYLSKQRYFTNNSGEFYS